METKKYTTLLTCITGHQIDVPEDDPPEAAKAEFERLVAFTKRNG